MASTPPDWDAEGITRCICDYLHDDGFMIACDKCLAWQHVACVGIDRNDVPERYLCEICNPRWVSKSRARAIQTRKKEMGEIYVVNNSARSGGIQDRDRDEESQDMPRSNSHDRKASRFSTTTPGSPRHFTIPSSESQEASQASDTQTTVMEIESGYDWARQKQNNVRFYDNGITIEDIPNGEYGDLSPPHIISSATPPASEKQSVVARRSPSFGKASSGSVLRSHNSTNCSGPEPSTTSTPSLHIKVNSGLGSTYLCPYSSSPYLDKYEDADSVCSYSPELRAKLQKNHALGRCSVPSVPDFTPLSTDMNRWKLGVTSLEGGKMLKTILAAVRVQPGEAIIEFVGKFLTLTGFNCTNRKASQGNPNSIKPEPFVFFDQVPKNGMCVCIDCRRYGNDARFVRRSCTPNAEIRHVVGKSTVHAYVVATAAIDVDDEVTIPHEFMSVTSNSVNSVVQKYHVVSPPLTCACSDLETCKAVIPGSTVGDVHSKNGALMSPTSIPHENKERRRRTSSRRTSSLDKDTTETQKMTREERKLKSVLKIIEKMESNQKKKESRQSMKKDKGKDNNNNKSEDREKGQDKNSQSAQAPVSLAPIRFAPAGSQQKGRKRGRSTSGKINNKPQMISHRNDSPGDTTKKRPDGRTARTVGLASEEAAVAAIAKRKVEIPVTPTTTPSTQRNSSGTEAGLAMLVTPSSIESHSTETHKMTREERKLQSVLKIIEKMESNQKKKESRQSLKKDKSKDNNNNKSDDQETDQQEVSQSAQPPVSQSPVGVECLAPLKKRKLARASMSSTVSNTPPSSPNNAEVACSEIDADGENEMEQNNDVRGEDGGSNQKTPTQVKEKQLMVEYSKRKIEGKSIDERLTALSNSNTALNTMSNTDSNSSDTFTWSGKEASSPKAEDEPSIRGSLQFSSTPQMTERKREELGKRLSKSFGSRVPEADAVGLEPPASRTGKQALLTTALAASTQIQSPREVPIDKQKLNGEVTGPSFGRIGTPANSSMGHRLSVPTPAPLKQSGIPPQPPHLSPSPLISNSGSTPNGATKSALNITPNGCASNSSGSVSQSGQSQPFRNFRGASNGPAYNNIQQARGLLSSGQNNQSGVNSATAGPIIGGVPVGNLIPPPPPPTSQGSAGPAFGKRFYNKKFFPSS